jgi:hypothetical protein
MPMHLPVVELVPVKRFDASRWVLVVDPKQCPLVV